MQLRSLIFVVISLLVVALVYGSIPTSGVFAAPKDPNFGGNCETIHVPGSGGRYVQTCCWTESVPPGTGNPNLGGSMEAYCQECVFQLGNENALSCSDKELQYLESTVPGLGEFPEGGVLEQPPPPPTGPFAPPQGGVIQQPPSEGEGAQPLTRGQGVLPQGSALQQQQQQPTDEEAARTVEPPAEEEATLPPPEPLPCPEGQVLDEETGLCVPEEPEQSELEEQDQEVSEEGQNSEGNTN
jgi:hypothetical protein